MHAVEVVHDTPARLTKPPPEPDERGLDWTDQLVPFQRSTNAELLNQPTAVHAVADVHDTPSRPLVVVPAGLGTVWIDQLVPFHRSANGRELPVLLIKEPTAMQAVLEVHDTCASPLDVAPGGPGMFWIDQLDPFHRSTSIRPSLSLFVEYPTAMQLVLEVQDTPLRLLKTAPGALAIDWLDQLVPFQTSPKVVSAVGMTFIFPTFAKAPTAVHAVLEVHITPLRLLPGSPAGVGVVWIDQLVPFHRSANITWW
jgi:hypothetical protein